MKIKKTKFKGLIILYGIKHKDKRGYLRELILEKLIKRNFKFQILSVSKKNVFQKFLIFFASLQQHQIPLL